jgi:DNA polymerase III delta prime subunit
MKIWNEDYRPKTFDDMLMPPNQREAFKKYLADGAIPNVIFYGAPGTGKTSSALIFIRELGAEHLRLNGSDERSIETVREQIKNFIQTKSFNTKRKIVFYDEAEALTPDAFKALKEITERYQKTASFIFATNFLYKFPEAIRSRCTLFEFKKPSKEDALIFLKGILVKEKVEFRPEDLDTIYRSCAGDLRRSLNYLQRWSISGNLELPQDTYAELYKLIKAGNIIDLKRYFAMNSCDWDGLYRFLFEHIEDPAKAILLAKYAYQDGFVVDKEINFIGFCAELSRLK